MRNYTRKTNRGLVSLELVQAAADKVLHKGVSIRKTAREMNICHITLSRFINRLKTGMKPTIGYKPKLLFNEEQEKQILKHLAEFAKVFCGLTEHELRKFAYQCAITLKLTNIPESWYKNGKASKDWADKFIIRHQVPIRPLPTETKDIVKSYSILHKLMEEYKFLPSRIYHLVDVVIRKVLKYKKNANGTVSTSISQSTPVNMQFAANATGVTVPPMFVTNEYKATYVIKKSSGCMTVKDFPVYLDHFIKHTKPNKSDPVLLLIDNQEYLDLNVLERARANSVVLLSFPKVHSIQPLKNIAKDVLESCNSVQVDWLCSKPNTTCDIPEIVSKVMLKVTEKDIVKCFRKTGVWPFNPTVVTGEEFVPTAVEEYDFKMARGKKPFRKYGNHTEENMRKAIELIQSGLSIRQASMQCLLSYATVRRYLQLTKNNQGKEIRLTPNYEVNRIFTTEEETCLVKYIKYCSKQFEEDLSSNDCRRVAYEMACIIKKKIPKRWTQDQKAGIEWFRLFKSRHPGLSVRKPNAGDVIKETVFDKQDMEAFFCYLNIAKEVKVSEQEVQPGPSKALAPTTSLDSTAFKEQDPLSSRVIDQCRFCGEFSKDCVPVSGNMPYLAHNKTTLVLNDTSVQLDFNDGSLPKTVCGDCDAKLQEIADFVNVVKSAQDTLISFAEEKAEYAETRVEFKVAKAEETVNTEAETLVIKTEYDSQHEESDDDKEDKEGIVDSLTVGETVFVKKTITHKRKSDSVTAKPKKLKTVKTKKCDDELIIDIKEEVIEKEGQGLSEVSDYVKPSELEMATNALVLEMAGEGTSEHQGYRSDR